MAEQSTPESISEVKIPTTQEVIEGYLALSEEEKLPVHERASRIRFGPTGMTEGEAILAAMAEKIAASSDTQEI